MKTDSEEAKKLNSAINKLKKLDLENPNFKLDLAKINSQKNQLEIEKKEIEEKYKSLMSEYKALNQKIEDMNLQKTNEQKKETEFSENIKFNGKDFLLSCDDGQEEHLEELLFHINQKFNDLKKDLGNLGENKLLLITAVQVMDEYFETKKKVEEKKKELENLSNKFRELKSLVYDYKDKKEEELDKLCQDHESFKKEIEKNKKDYEKIIEEAANEIEDYVEKVNLKNSVQ